MMRSLSLNLASRPFRNNTLVWAGYVVLLLAAAGFSYWNVSSYGHYKRELVDLDAVQGNMDQEQLDLRNRHGQIVRAVRTFDVKAIGRRTSKANQVIEWKAFSWTRLFNRLEEMLPNNVRMTSVRPIFREADRNEDDADLRQSISVTVEGLARDLDAFLQIQTELIQHESFGYVRPRYADRTDNGEYSFGVEFLYYPGEPIDLGDSIEAETADSGEEPADEPVAAAAAAGAEGEDKRELPPIDPQPAEVTDDWAEHTATEDEATAKAEDSRPKRRTLPRVEPDSPESAKTDEQGGGR